MPSPGAYIAPAVTPPSSPFMWEGGSGRERLQLSRHRWRAPARGLYNVLQFRLVWCSLFWKIGSWKNRIPVILFLSRISKKWCALRASPHRLPLLNFTQVTEDRSRKSVTSPDGCCYKDLNFMRAAPTGPGVGKKEWREKANEEDQSRRGCTNNPGRKKEKGMNEDIWQWR